MGDINWAVLGTGVIANEMAVALNQDIQKSPGPDQKQDPSVSFFGIL